MKNQKGFTLLELLIVVIIIGILASIAMPQYMKTIERAKTAEALTNLATLRGAMERYWYEKITMGVAYNPLDDPEFPVNVVDVAAVDDDIPLDIDNPNADPERKWDYGLAWDAGNVDAPRFALEAQLRLFGDNAVRRDVNKWIQMNYDGEVRKAPLIGGRAGEEKFPE